MDEYCRGCLNVFNDPTELKQYTEESRRLFVYSTGLQVKRHDIFTFQLCKECYFSMKTSCKFKKMCRTSDKKIKRYLALKDIDDEIDFSSFLKKDGESLTFRLPLLSGNSTPANQKAKDDDNESTCTSIQNFMTDIIRAEEIPDSEARIIKELIEEEADVLEDSLDSHWLQDDGSVDEDFQLDISLSRFSTPISTNHERMTSPDPREVTSTDITSGEDYDNIPVDSSLKKITDPVDETLELQNIICGNKQETTNKRCVIDKNLDMALKDENNKEFSLEQLLASPPAFSKSNISGASTPTIKHILFGEKLVNKKVKSPNFETDLDLLIGKLNKGKSNKKLHEKKLVQDKTIEKETKEDKVDFAKLLEGKEFKEPFCIDNNLLNNEESKSEINIGLGKGKSKTKILKVKKSKTDNIDLEMLVKNKLLKEKFDLENQPNLGELLRDDKEKLNFGKFFEEAMDLENFDDEKLQLDEPDMKRVRILHDGKLDFSELCIERLLEDKPHVKKNTEKVQGDIQKGKTVEMTGEKEESKVKIIKDFKLDFEEINIEKSNISKMITEKSADRDQGKSYIENIQRGKSVKSCVSSQGDDSNHAILKEFFEIDCGKFSSMGKKEKSIINSGSVAQIDDAQLTELLDEAYDPNIALIKGQKSINNQNSQEESIFEPHIGKSKKILSPMEKKYCVTNFYCKMCNKKFKNLQSLKLHFTRCHQYRIYTPKKPRVYKIKICDLCGQEFTNTKSLVQHLRNHDKPKEYSCEICTLIFKSANALKTHRTTHIGKVAVEKSEEAKLKYVCTICGAISTSASNHVTHQRRHSKSYTVHCPECGRGFYRNPELATHMRSHTGEKPFACLYCERSFTRRDGLNRHMKLHTAEKPFSCDLCKRKFIRRHDLKNHQLKNCLET